MSMFNWWQVVICLFSLLCMSWLKAQDHICPVPRSGQTASREEIS